jgi:hypothetical protein
MRVVKPWLVVCGVESVGCLEWIPGVALIEVLSTSGEWQANHSHGEISELFGTKRLLALRSATTRESS